MPQIKSIVFQLTQLTLFYCADQTYLIGKLVDTELKGQYKTVWGLQICWSLINYDEAFWNGKKNIQCFHENEKKCNVKQN